MERGDRSQPAERRGSGQDALAEVGVEPHLLPLVGVAVDRLRFEWTLVDLVADTVLVGIALGTSVVVGEGTMTP